MLTNIDNTILGAGKLGAGQTALVNEGTIVATGDDELGLDTGDERDHQLGTLEATGPVDWSSAATSTTRV